MIIFTFVTVWGVLLVPYMQGAYYTLKIRSNLCLKNAMTLNILCVIFYNLILNEVGDVFIQLKAEVHSLYCTDIYRVRECLSV
jgi:hypothetical protein